MSITEAKPYLAAIDKLITDVKNVPEHYIVNETDRSAYLKGLLDAKRAVLDMVEYIPQPEDSDVQA